MSKIARVLNIYLPEPMRADAAAGRVNIVNRIVAALGWPVVYHPVEDWARGEGFSLGLMTEPVRDGQLCLRRAYHYPFWQIEATNERWNFDVAKAAFVVGDIDPALARPFFRRWRDKVLGEVTPSRQGFVFMPLQGRLLQHRSFQTMSPVAMIEATLEAEPKRAIKVTLHPKEVYLAKELAALQALERRFSRFQVVTGDAKALVMACDYVVTQNSSVAMTGFFARKPAVLFAGIDFHHIAGVVARDGLAGAFAKAGAEPPDFAGYLYWFFKLHCINGGAPEAEDQIRARLQRHGWPI